MKYNVKKEAISKKFVDIMEKQRTEMGLTQEQMARKMELSTSGYKKIVSGETRKVDLYIAYKLNELTGNRLIELFEADSRQNSLLVKMRQLSESQMRLIEGVVDFELGFQNAQPKHHGKFITIYEPVCDFVDGMIWDSAKMSKADVGMYAQMFRDKLFCGIRLNSNQYMPVYFKGDVLLISKAMPQNGEVGIYISRENGRAYIRKYIQAFPCLLEPVNEFGDVFQMNPDDPEEVSKWICFGRIITKMRE